jgi:hypothetical protein
MAASDRIKLPSGAVIQRGQLRQPAPPVIGERDQTNSKIGRDPTRSKNVGTVPIAHGMRNVGAKGHGLAFKGGKRPLDDEPLQKTWQDGKSVPIHDGMGTHPRSAHERGIVKDVRDGSAHLRQAGIHNHNERQATGYDDTLIAHRVPKGTALTPLPRKGRDR